jgi:hypothetical protein
VTALGHLRRHVVAVAKVCYGAMRSKTKPTLFPLFPGAQVSSVREERAAPNQVIEEKSKHTCAARRS